MLLINLVAYRESLLRIAIQEAAKQNLVNYALYPMLDYLGELVGVFRLDSETDDQLRERIKLAPESFSVAGSRLSYVFWAKSADPTIFDVAVLSPDPGVVTIYPLTATGTPGQDVLDKVLAACSAEDVRPLCDLVRVVSPTRKPFELVVSITPYAWPGLDNVRVQAQTSLDAYTATLRTALGRDVIINQIIAAAGSVYGVYKATVSAPAVDIINAAFEWSDCTGITITMSEAING